jgi:hypothetical protein
MLFDGLWMARTAREFRNIIGPLLPPVIEDQGISAGNRGAIIAMK